MILRALLTLKSLIYQPVNQATGKCFSLFQIKASYEHPFFTTSPTLA